MADPRIQRLAAQVLEAISDPRVCGRGADALRNMIKRELRSALAERTPQADRAIDHSTQRIAG